MALAPHVVGEQRDSSGSDGIMGNSARRIALSQLAKDTIFPIDFMLTHIF
jgi:hypothetical protein